VGNGPTSADELHSAALYDMADVERDGVRSDVYPALAMSEREHARWWPKSFALCRQFSDGVVRPAATLNGRTSSTCRPVCNRVSGTF
jgi:hypothetical protein